MTKAYLNLPKKPISFLPHVGSRRFSNMGIAYRDGGDPDPDEEAKLLGKIKTMVAAELATRATKDQVEQIISQMKMFNPEGAPKFPIESLRSMADPNTGAMKILATQGEQINELRAKMEEQNQNRTNSVRSQVAKWQKDNKEALVRVMNRESKDIPVLDLNIRAADSPMTPSTVNAGASPYIGRIGGEPGVNDFIRAQPIFWDYIPKGRTNLTTYYWVNKTNPQGAAGFLAPGQAKPGVSFSLASEASNPKKVADSLKTATETLQDIDGMTTFIMDELKYQVDILTNQKCMVDPGSSIDPKGIQNYSQLYTLNSVKTANPNYFDCIRAVVAQLRSGWLMGDITVFINSIDAANLDLAKANNAGVYVIPPFATANGTKIGGATVVEDNNVAVGHVQAAFLRFYRILMYQDFSVRWGFENDDFTKNLMTAVGEQRFHQFVNSIYSNSGAFVYDTFANITAAIAKV